MLIEKLFRLIAYYLCLSTHQVTFGFKTLDGRFNKAYINKDQTRRLSLESCLNYYCQGETSCVVNYNNFDLTCRHAAFFSAQVLEWAADKHVIHDKNWKIAYRLTNPFPKVPIIVFLLDQAARGNNYGSIPALIVTEKYLDYGRNTKGPRPGVSLIYPQGLNHHSLTDVLAGGAKEPLFKLIKPFTMAMWIKTTKQKWQTLLATWVWDMFWETNRPSLGQMSFCVVYYCAVTEKNMTNIFEWRHVALIMNLKAPKIYIDGYETKLVKNDIKPNPGFKKRTHHLLLFGDKSQIDLFKGAMACVTVFQPFLLSDSEIRNLRKICP